MAALSGGHHGFMRSFLLILVSSVLAAAADRPNILWITAEDMSPNLGCWGDAYAHTPTLDKFAEESVRYTNAFATAPVCSPSRSCLITGVYAQTLGTHQMRSAFEIPETIKAWPSYLRQAGYYTCNNVKTDYNTASETRLIAEAWDDTSATAHWRNRPDREQPFFAVFNDMTTHQSRSMTWSYEKFQLEVQSKLAPENIHDPDKAPVPSYYPDTPVIRKTLARYYDCISVMDQHTGDLLKQLELDGFAEDTIVFFYSDHGAGLPRHKRVLHDSGMQVPLMIRFPEKYRHLAPDAPGARIDRLVSFVDFPPSVLSLLGLEIPNVMQGIPFLGEAAKDHPPREIVYGARDRIDEVFDFARSIRTNRFLYIRNYMPYYGWNQRSVYPDQSEIRHELYRTPLGEMTEAQQAYAGPERPREELYDVGGDPQQIKNLAGDAEHAETLATMRQRLREEALKIRDLGYLPERDQVRLAKSRLSFELASGSNPLDMELLIDQVESRFEERELSEERLVGDLKSEQPFTVLEAIRLLELRTSLGKPAMEGVEAAYHRWKGRQDTPLALFIRFSCEAILRIKSVY